MLRLISVITMGNKASKQTLPAPQAIVDGTVVVLLGYTGAGKSTLGNVLLGKTANDGAFFQPVAGALSGTEETVFKTGRWLGKRENPVFTIVDTPGFSDNRKAKDERKAIVKWFEAKSRDTIQRDEMVRTLKEKIGAAHVFLWVKKAGDRFSATEKEYFSLYSEVFGRDHFQERLIMVLTQ